MELLLKNRTTFKQNWSLFFIQLNQSRPFFIHYFQRNGADFSVFLNTASEFDGSDSGARPDEAVSWGKIRKDATPVKIYAEATLILPLLVGQTFAKRHFLNKPNQDSQQ